MSVNVFGFDDGMIVEPGAELSEAADSGMVTFSESRKGTTAQAIALYNSLTRLSSTHPTFIFLALDDKKLVYEEAGQAAVKLNWKGSSAETSGTPPLPSPVWRLSRSPSQEPIDTHPDFADFAGTPAAPLNGAEFDPETGLFVGFKSADPNVWGGVTKHLESGAVMTKTSVVRVEPSTNEVIPRIDTPSGSTITVPTITGRNWLKTDFQIDRKGSVYEVFEEWTMSGQQGWNTTIYPT